MLANSAGPDEMPHLYHHVLGGISSRSSLFAKVLVDRYPE